MYVCNACAYVITVESSWPSRQQVLHEIQDTFHDTQLTLKAENYLHAMFSGPNTKGHHWALTWLNIPHTCTTNTGTNYE